MTMALDTQAAPSVEPGCTYDQGEGDTQGIDTARFMPG